MAMDSDIIIDDYYDQGFDESLMSDDQQYLDMDAPAVSLVWETCMYPSIVQVSQHMFTYVIWNLVFRFTSQTSKSYRRCGLCFLSQKSHNDQSTLPPLFPQSVCREISNIFHRLHVVWLCNGPY